MIRGISPGSVYKNFLVDFGPFFIFFLRSELAQCGVSLITTVIMYLNLIRQRTVSFMDDENARNGEIASQFQSTVSLLLSSVDTYNTRYAKVRFS